MDNSTMVIIIVLVILVVFIVIFLLSQNNSTINGSNGIQSYIHQKELLDDPSEQWTSWYTEEINKQKRNGFDQIFLYGNLVLPSSGSPTGDLMEFALQKDNTFVTYTYQGSKTSLIGNGSPATIFYLFRHPISDIAVRFIEIQGIMKATCVEEKIYKLTLYPRKYSFVESDFTTNVSYTYNYVKEENTWTKEPTQIYNYSKLIAINN